MLSRLVLSLFLSALWPAVSPGASDLEAQRALFLKAEQALNQGQPDRARALAEELEDYPLRPYLLHRILSQGGGDIPAFLERYGTTRHAAPLRKAWLRELAGREAWDEVVRRYRETDDAETRCHYYYALHRLGRSRDAYAGAAGLWATPESLPEACEKLFAAWRASPEFTQDQIWKRYALALRKEKPALAGRLRTLLPAEAQGQADFWLEVHGNPKQVEQCGLLNPADGAAGRIFAHGIDRLAGTEPLAAQNLWNLRHGDFELDRDERDRVQRRLALELATQRYPQAWAYLGALPEGAADGSIRTWRLRTALYRQDWPGVLIAYAELDAAERRQTAWRYWQARALEALGEPQAAREIFRSLAGERDFYGFSAADRLRQNYGLSFAPSAVSDAERQRLLESGPLRAVREFRALNREGEARKEWLHAIKSLGERERVVAAQVAQEWGWHRLAILAAAQADSRDALALKFPLAYDRPARQYAALREIDPALVLGLIRRESAFDAEAKSPAGALGLMQLMPGTGAEMARLLKESWRSERSLLEPDVNLRYGSAYFRGLMDRFHHHFALAAAAYNAGPNRVERWRPVRKPMPADIWVETLPFIETRQYVIAVLSHAVIYSERLGGAGLRISDFLADIEPGAGTEPGPDRPRPVALCR
jgi:soluble lytic murein transglycosylase